MEHASRVTTSGICIAASAALIILSGCSSSNNSSPQNEGSAWTQGVFDSPEDYRDLCASPRSGIDPRTDQEYADQQGTALDEKLWLRSMMHHFYLWTDDMSDPNPSNFASLDDYYRRLLVSEDQFSYSLSEQRHHDMFVEGTDTSYGIRWETDHSDPNVPLFIGQVQQNSPNIDLVRRGDQVIAVNGVDWNTDDEAFFSAINAALYPETSGETNEFTLLDRETQNERTVTLTAAPVTNDSVYLYQTLDTDRGTVGYLMLDDFNIPAQEPMIEAVGSLLDPNISDLVLDLRYNPGGSLVLASQLGYMIAGPQATDEKTFYHYAHNTMVAPYYDEPLPFLNSLFDFDGWEPDESAPLDSLDLPRVFVVTSPRSCSASEALINGLRGINVDVVQIGGTTCGKPYGYYSVKNCGTVYNFQWFRGENDHGYGDYKFGFTPTDDPALQTSSNPPGCVVQEDFAHALGDKEEKMLATVLAYRKTGVCPSASAIEDEGLEARIESQRHNPVRPSAFGRHNEQGKILKR